MKRVAIEDLEHIFINTKPLWEKIRGKSLFITGGTGFFGKWLLESFIYCNKQLQLNAKITVLSREPEKFLKDFPFYINYNEVSFLKGNILDFEFPNEKFDFIIHAATEASVRFNIEQPLLMFDTIVSGSRRILDFAKLNNVESILHTSSGAVYGNQPFEIANIEETYSGSPKIYEKSSAYGEGKRVAEMFANLYYQKYGVKSKIARCYAFVGPYLPLDASFAVGNFIKDVLSGNQISILGDGTSFRSYLYASDLVIWLWTILIQGQICKPYNVGSDVGITIEELAIKVASFGKLKTEVKINHLRKEIPNSNYVPSVKFAKNDLGLEVKVTLEESLKKTFQFYLQNYA
jgi:nucleoside-diphosphate-sugar epimerase